MRFYQSPVYFLFHLPVVDDQKKLEMRPQSSILQQRCRFTST